MLRDLVGTVGAWVIYTLIWIFGRRYSPDEISWLIGPLGGTSIGDRPYEETAAAEGFPLLRSVRFPNLLATVHQSCAGNGVLISWVHSQYPRPPEFPGSPRRVFSRISLSLKEKHFGPHDASNGGVMRLRITRWATRDQDADRTETLTTDGQWIQEAGVSLPGPEPRVCPPHRHRTSIVEAESNSIKFNDRVNRVAAIDPPLTKTTPSISRKLQVSRW